MIGRDRCVVAVDGPSGSGKSTISRRLAIELDAQYLDTGAMYRAVTWAVLREGVDVGDPDAVAAVAQQIDLRIGTDPRHELVSVDGERIEQAIRQAPVTAAVSAVSAAPQVRKLLVERQQGVIASVSWIVVEGRDIGTVVAPDADLKVYLTASATERARRRSAESRDGFEATRADLTRRDEFDSTRAVDPLRQATDAVELDTTELDIDQVVTRMRAMLNESVTT